MKASAPQKLDIPKLIFILLVIVASVSTYLYFRSPTPSLKNTGGAVTPTPRPTGDSRQPSILPTVEKPVEGQIGTVESVMPKTDGQYELIVVGGTAGVKKTYLFPSDQKVRLFTSASESTSVPIGQIKKGTYVIIKKFAKPERYEIIGSTSSEVFAKLI
jgi:hypothetical protein